MSIDEAYETLVELAWMYADLQDDQPELLDELKEVSNIVLERLQRCTELEFLLGLMENQ